MHLTAVRSKLEGLLGVCSLDRLLQSIPFKVVLRIISEVPSKLSLVPIRFLGRSAISVANHSHRIGFQEIGSIAAAIFHHP